MAGTTPMAIPSTSPTAPRARCRSRAGPGWRPCRSRTGSRLSAGPGPAPSRARLRRWSRRPAAACRSGSPQAAPARRSGRRRPAARRAGPPAAGPCPAGRMLTMRRIARSESAVGRSFMYSSVNRSFILPPSPSALPGEADAHRVQPALEQTVAHRRTCARCPSWRPGRAGGEAHGLRGREEHARRREAGRRSREVGADAWPIAVRPPSRRRRCRR